MTMASKYCDMGPPGVMPIGPVGVRRRSGSDWRSSALFLTLRGQCRSVRMSVRTSARWEEMLRKAVVGLGVLLTLCAVATATPSAAQDTTTGAAVVPSPAPGGSTRQFLDKVQIELGYTYDDNVTLGRTSDEILWDQFVSLNVSASRAFPISDNTRLVVTGLLGGEKYFNYNGLSNLSGGLDVELQYRRSGAFDAITFAAFARGWLVNYDSHLRDGSHYSAGVNARGAVTDRISLFGELAWNQRRAQSEVWDLTDYSALVNLDYSVGRGTLYATGQYL